MAKFKQQVRWNLTCDEQAKGIVSLGLDVTVPEPLPTDHRLLTLDNCTIFPHIGSADISARHQMAQLCVDNLLNFFSGKPMVRELKLDTA